MSKKSYKFNLIQLEEDALQAYDAWVNDDTSDNRTSLFETFRNLAFAVVSVGKYGNIDKEEVAYEFAFYMFDRIVLGNFRFISKNSNGRFPLQHYFRRSVKHVINTHRSSDSWLEFVSDLEFLVETSPICDPSVLAEDSEDYFNEIATHQFSQDLFRCLRIYYSYDDIVRLLNISFDMIYANPRYFVGDGMPKDVRDFTIILISVSKRLALQQNINRRVSNFAGDLNNATLAAIRSTIFLSTVVNAKFFPKEFLLALDIDSLYRLVSLCGGQTIRIPTMRELDTLLGSVIAVARVITEGRTSQEFIKETKDDLDLVFSNHVNMKYFMSKIIETYELFGDEEESEPLLNILMMSVKSIEGLLEDLSVDVEDNDLLDSYRELSSSVKNLASKVNKMNSKLPKEKLDV